MKIKGFFYGRSLREKRKLTVTAITVSLEFRNRSNKTSKASIRGRNYFYSLNLANFFPTF